MGIDITSFTNFLSQSPGDLIFFLVVSLPLILTLVFGMFHLKKAENRLFIQHVMTGCEILLFLEIIILMTSLFSPIDLTKTTIVFIIVECLAVTLLITWLTWIFLEEKDSFLFNGLSLFLTNTLILASAGSVLWVIFLPDSDLINALGLFKLWYYLSLTLILVGLTRIIATRPKQWIVVAAMLALLGAGFIVQILFLGHNSFHMSAVRLAQMLSLPWILLILRRFWENAINNSTIQGREAIREGSNLVDTKPALIDELLKISLQETPEAKYKAVVRAISMSVVSDICYLAKITNEENKVQVLAGYDLIRERFLPEPSLSRGELPQIMNSWQNNRSIRLSRNDIDTLDASTMAKQLRYPTVGNLLAYPISQTDESPSGGVIFLSPYTNKPWEKDIVELMDRINNTLFKVVFSQTSIERMNAKLDLSRNDKGRLQNEKNALTQVLIEKQSEINDQNTTIKQLKARFQIEKLATVKQIEHLQKEINKLITQAAEFGRNASECEQLHNEISQLSNEKNRLQKALTLANARIHKLEEKAEQTGPFRLSMESKIVSLDAIAANIKQQTVQQMQQKQQNFELINPDGRQMVKTDPELLHNVLFGLLDNAIKASELGGKLQMTLKLSLETGMLIIEVTDYGEGLTPTEQGALFSTGHENIPGIGSIQSIRDSIRAMRLLQGKIWLKSKKDSYTTFRVQVPVRIID